jgi:SAM-dependent methyltransferase
MNPFKITWDTLDWAALDRLRDTFLAAEPGCANYWMSRSDLENYDFTFGQRIAWKWDAVLRELRLRGWTPPSSRLLDWGCGSGIAGRRVVEFFGSEAFSSLSVFDRSPLAIEWAVERAQEAFPSLRAQSFPYIPLHDSPERRPPVRRDPSPPNAAGSETGAPPVGTLIISHVLNELTDAGVQPLRETIERADAVLWVEPGTYAASRALIEVRERLREQFLLIAPCTHQAACGLFAPENERHWCHHFASPPPNIMGDSNWVRFAQRAGIDLRSLPYSFLVLERKGLHDPVPGLLPDGHSRIIGAPRMYKGYAKIFTCQTDGVRDLTLQKRDAPHLFKALKDKAATPFQRWTVVGGRIEPA